MKVIAISGRAQHGKDTIAKMLKKKLEDECNRVLITHYADLLKYICKAFWEWDGEKDEDGRRLLQYVGTDIVRRKDPDFWVNTLIKILEFFKDRWRYIVIPDVRFPNEVEKLREKGYDVVHIFVDRPHFENDLTEEQNLHISESAILNTKPDFYILNDGTLHDLESKIDKWIEENLKHGDKN